MEKLPDKSVDLADSGNLTEHLMYIGFGLTT